MMEAVVIRQFGGSEVLEIVTTERPEPKLHEVVLRVHAVGVNPIDWKTREGQGLWRDNGNLPGVLGWDVSGTVVAKGRLVSGFEEGDEAFGLASLSEGGGYAEFVRVPMEQLAHKPDDIDHAHSAAVPMAGLTAYQALFDIGRVREGRRVLIHGAAGGVGHIAVQLAKSQGANVTGTASQRNLEFIRALGADDAIDYASVPFERAVSATDVVLDTVGGEVTERSLDVLARHGVVVTLETPQGPRGMGANRVRPLRVRPDQYQLEKLAGYLAEGTLRTSVTTISGLRGIPDAHRISETRHVRGKVVVVLE
jgi:NADPH:quinone reductase-like Zn-dependent oxidoreductase